MNNNEKDSIISDGFALIGYENIDKNHLWRDGIHLTNEGTSLLSKNILENLNSFFHQNMVLV